MTDDKESLLREALPVLQAYALDNPKWYRIDHCGGPGILQDPCGVHALIPRITAALEGGKDGGWIPVSERLPEEGDEVLLLHDKVCRTAGFRKGGRYSSDDGVFPICNVTAWQPLPALPKEK